MIDPKELRIGNYLLSGGEAIQIDAAHLCDLLTSEYYLLGHTQIPITPEWLERLGFAVGKRSIYKDFGFFEIEYERDQLYIGINEYQDSLYHIQYVHQLQNLVYSLTGQELIIKQ